MPSLRYPGRGFFSRHSRRRGACSSINHLSRPEFSDSIGASKVLGSFQSHVVFLSSVGSPAGQLAELPAPYSLAQHVLDMFVREVQPAKQASWLCGEIPPEQPRPPSPSPHHRMRRTPVAVRCSFQRRHARVGALRESAYVWPGTGPPSPFNTGVLDMTGGGVYPT